MTKDLLSELSRRFTRNTNIETFEQLLPYALDAIDTLNPNDKQAALGQLVTYARNMGYPLNVTQHPVKEPVKIEYTEQQPTKEPETFQYDEKDAGLYSRSDYKIYFLKKMGISVETAKFITKGKNISKKKLKKRLVELSRRTAIDEADRNLYTRIIEKLERYSAANITEPQEILDISVEYGDIPDGVDKDIPDRIFGFEDLILSYRHDSKNPNHPQELFYADDTLYFETEKSKNLRFEENSSKIEKNRDERPVEKKILPKKADKKLPDDSRPAITKHKNRQNIPVTDNRGYRRVDSFIYNLSEKDREFLDSVRITYEADRNGLLEKLLECYWKLPFEAHDPNMFETQVCRISSYITGHDIETTDLRTSMTGKVDERKKTVSNTYNFVVMMLKNIFRISFVELARIFNRGDHTSMISPYRKAYEIAGSRIEERRKDVSEEPSTLEPKNYRIQKEVRTTKKPKKEQPTTEELIEVNYHDPFSSVKELAQLLQSKLKGNEFSKQTITSARQLLDELESLFEYRIDLSRIEIPDNKPTKQEQTLYEEDLERYIRSRKFIESQLIEMMEAKLNIKSTRK